MCHDDRQVIPAAGAFLPGPDTHEASAAAGPQSAGEAPSPQSAGEAPSPQSAGEAPSPQSAGEAPSPQSAGEAVGLMLAGLRWLARADLASAPAAVQADCLRE